MHSMARRCCPSYPNSPYHPYLTLTPSLGAAVLPKLGSGLGLAGPKPNPNPNPNPHPHPNPHQVLPKFVDNFPPSGLTLFIRAAMAYNLQARQ